MSTDEVTHSTFEVGASRARSEWDRAYLAVLREDLAAAAIASPGACGRRWASSWSDRPDISHRVEPLVAFTAVTGVDERLNPARLSSLRRMLQDL